MKNVNVQDGLVNSATGIVTGFLPSPSASDTADTFNPKYILIDFDDSRVGKQTRSQSRGIIPHDLNTSTPICRVESQMKLGKYSKVTSKRVQFPLVLAWAVTIHKEQGKTEETLVISCKGTFQAGQFYTAIRRTKSLEGLHFLDTVSAAKIKVNHQALAEITRMRSSVFTPPEYPTLQPCPEDIFSIQLFNSNSLKPHWTALNKDGLISSSHIVCFPETWTESPKLPNLDFHSSFSNTQTSQRGGGLATYIHHHILCVRHYIISNLKTEHHVIISPKQLQTLRVCVVLKYHNQTTCKDLPQ